MKKLVRYSILLCLIRRLQENGSWCGETHIQKSTYFLQKLLNVPTNFDFILYKHGPYSFDLSDEISALRADGYLNLIPQQPYGASLYPSEQIQNILERFPKTIAKYSPQIDFVAKELSNMGVAELERIATALYVMNENDIKTKERAKRIHELKPHISIDLAKITLQKLEKIVGESESIKINSIQ